MDALVLAAPDTAIVAKRTIPTPSSDEILVQVKSVALNPVDALYAAHPISKNPDRVVGSDFAGIVVGLGDQVTQWKVGDRVASFVQGACSTNDRPGAFAEYATTPADLAFRVPSGVDFTEAATLPLCLLTSAQALFLRLRLPPPFPTSAVAEAKVAKSPALLIYGASTTIGLFALQLAKLVKLPDGEHLRIFGTASARNHALLKDLGIDGVVDYKSSDWPEQIKQLSGGITHAFDCISEGTTTGSISETFVSEGGSIAVIRGAAWDAKLVREGVVPLYGAVWTGLGVEIGYNGAILPAVPESRQFSRDLYKFLSDGSATDATKLPVNAPPIRLMPGGLSRIVEDGFELLGSGTVGGRTGGATRTEEWMKPISAEKLVYTL